MNPRSDVQSEKSQQFEGLNWVGMTSIQTALTLPYVNQQTLTVPARLNVGVNLKENNRGIHMSRLYQLMQNDLLLKTFSAETFSHFLKDCLDSQEHLSDAGSFSLSYEHPRETRALVSEHKGFRQYAVKTVTEMQKGEAARHWIQVEILYSSTCPQSARLSLEVQQNKKTDLNTTFQWPATPHAQRSRAFVTVLVQDFKASFIDELIEKCESSLGTAVQTTVKKSDEMRFAELNAENLMFCEDAVRKLMIGLRQIPAVTGFKVLCVHEESLHPHNATSLSQWNFFEPKFHPIA